MKLFKLLSALSLAMLTACNSANFSYPVEKFHTIDSATFAESSEITEMSAGRRVRGPKIAYALGTYGGLSVFKRNNGDVRFSFYARLEYTDYDVRGYSSVTDASGAKLNSSYSGGAEGNGGYRAEIVSAQITEAMIEEARTKGLSLTIAAPTRNGPKSTGVFH